MTRSIKRGGKVYIKIFPHKSVTKKPAEVRMGSGKGAPEYWVAVVKAGQSHVRDRGRIRRKGKRSHETCFSQAPG